MADKSVFAFDFILENARELRENGNVDIVEFKLLDFPAVSIVLRARETDGDQRIRSSRLDTRTHPQRKRDHAGDARSAAKICKGKSVVFELDPQELFQDLKKVPLKVRLQRSERREGATEQLARTDEGILDLSEMAVSMEALLASQKLHSCRYSSRNTVVIPSDAMLPKATKLCVKLRLVCIGGTASRDASSCEIIPERVDSTCSQNRESASDKPPLKHGDRPGSLTESVEPKPQSSQHSICAKYSANVNRESDQNKLSELHESHHSRDDPTRTDDSSGTRDPTTCINTVDTDTHHISNSHEDVYIPNSVCPPPLVYHSKQRKVSACTQHIPSCQKTPICGPPCSDEAWNKSIVQTEGYNDWSVLASYDQTSNPITTQLPNQRKPVEKLSQSHPPQTEESPLTRNLPLLTALLEELSHLHSCARGPNEMPKKVFSSETGDIPRTEDGETGKGREHKVKVAPSPRKARGGRFVRKCCMGVRPTMKVVPSNKSVLYPPDIKHKQQCSKQSRSTSHVQRKRARSDRNQEFKQDLSKRKGVKREGSYKAFSETGSVKPNNTTSSPKMVPVAPQYSSSPSVSHDSPARSPAMVPRGMNAATQTETTSQEVESASMPYNSPARTMVHREIVRPNAATQTETTVNEVQVVESSSMPHNSPARLPTMVHREMIRLNATTQTETIVNEEIYNRVIDTPREQLLETESKTQENEMCNSEASDDSGRTSPSTSQSSFAQDDSLALPSPERQEDSWAKLSSSVQTEEYGDPSLRRNSVLSQTLPVQGSRFQLKQQSSACQKLSRQKMFSSTGDVRIALPESPLLHSTTKGSVISLHDTSLHANGMLDRAHNNGGSQTFDSFMSTDMLATVGEKGVLPRHLRDGIVFLATSQSSLASETNGQEQTECTGLVADNQKELVEEKGAEVTESSGETDYSDDFEDSDSLEASSNSTS